MPRRDRSGRPIATTCACPRSRAKPAAGQKVRTALRPPAESGRTGGNSVFPVYAGPRSPRRGWELSGVSRKEPRAPAVSDRTWPDETRGRPPGPPAYPPLRPSRPSQRSRAEPRRKPKNDHRGSHRAADPGALFSRIGRACARAFVTILLRRRTTCPGPPSKRSATRRQERSRSAPRRSGEQPGAAAQRASPLRTVRHGAIGVNHGLQFFNSRDAAGLLSSATPRAAPV